MVLLSFIGSRRHRIRRTRNTIGNIYDDTFHAAIPTSSTIGTRMMQIEPVLRVVFVMGCCFFGTSRHIVVVSHAAFLHRNHVIPSSITTTNKDLRQSSGISTHPNFSKSLTPITKRFLYTPNALGSAIPNGRIEAPPTRHGSYKRRDTECRMALLPLDVGTLERIISSSGKPTGAQYATYWGRTMKERYGRTIESATVGFLGVFFSYFLSFIVGGFVATILGSLFFFWGILSPELKAYQRNWEFLGGRQLVDSEIVQERRLDPEQAGLYGGLFVGHIEDVCVVEDTNDLEVDEYDLSSFSDYTMETDELDRYSGQPYLLRIRCTDRLGRTLQVHTRLSEDYLDLQAGMPSAMLLLSTSPTFSKLAALTDIFVLMSDDDSEVIEGCWIGDYPYLDRIEFEALLAEDDELWNALLDESSTLDDESSSSRKSEYKNTKYDDTKNDENRNKVLIPVKGRTKR